MSFKVKRIIPLLGMLFLFGYAAMAVSREARELKQALPQAVSSLAAVKSVEVRDAGGQVILSGSFTFKNKRGGDVKGAAILAATGLIADAKGDAEIEVRNGRDGQRKQELDVEVEKLIAGGSYNLYVDGQQVVTFAADGGGEADLELTNETSQ